MRTYLLILVLAGACGDDGGVHHQPDAPVAPDAPSDAPSGGPVAITLTSDGAGVPDVPVYFQNADSSLVATMMTDATGTATVMMRGGGFVTVVDPLPPLVLPFAGPFGGVSFHDVRTFAGVQPGDHLRLTQHLPVSVTFTLTLPIDPTASTYRVRTSCGETSLPGSGGSGAAPSGLVTLTDCNGVADILVESLDVNSAPLHAFYHPGQVVAPNATVTLADTYGDPAAVAYTFSSLPAAATAVRFTTTLASTHGPIAQTQMTLDAVAGGAMTSLPQPVLSGATAITATRVSPLANLGELSVIDWGPASATLSYNLASTQLPDYLTPATVDIATHAVSWTATTSTVQPDLAVLAFSSSRTAPTPIGYDWQIASRYTGPSVLLPVLPGAAATYNVVAGDSTSVYRQITAKVPGGYDAVRNVILQRGDLTGLVAGPTGRLVIEAPAPVTVTLPASGSQIGDHGAPGTFTRATR